MQYDVHLTENCPTEANAYFAIAGPYWFGQAFEDPPRFTWSATNNLFSGAVGTLPKSAETPTWDNVNHGGLQFSGLGVSAVDALRAQTLTVPVGVTVGSITLRLLLYTPAVGVEPIPQGEVTVAAYDGADPTSLGTFLGTATISEASLPSADSPGIVGEGEDVESVWPAVTLYFSTPFETISTNLTLVLGRTQSSTSHVIAVHNYYDGYAGGDTWFYNDVTSTWTNPANPGDIVFQLNAGSPNQLTVGVAEWLTDDRGMYLGAMVWFQINGQVVVECN